MAPGRRTTSSSTSQRVASATRDEPVEFAELWRPHEASGAPTGPAAILLKHGVVTAEQLAAAVERQKETPQLTVLEVLRRAGAIDETAALKATAAYFNLSYMALSAEDIDEKVFGLLNPEFIKRKNVLPVRQDNGEILVAVSDPADIFLIDEVKRNIRMPVRLVVSSASNILALSEELGSSALEAMEDIIQGITEDDVEVVEHAKDEVTDLEKIAGESPVIRYVNYLIHNAVQEEASDIHIEPGEDCLRIRYRIDGILFEQTSPPLRMHAAIISRVKIMAKINIAERRLPQDGRIRAMIRGRHVDLRVSTLPTVHGEKCVIRILDNRSILIGLERLGMWDDMLEGFRKQASQPHGILLVTGPTGSGKTTTLYSALRVMDGNTLNISTVEDPVEYQLSFANQVHVQEHIGLTFASALRSLLRQDPDVIMIGEIRDEETARIAVQASLTGHLVLSTLHTNDSASSITRLINIGIEPYLIAASVNAALAQRLVRRICENCKKPETDIRDSVAKYLASQKACIEQIYVGAGCDKCRHTGYAGRLGLYEMLVMDDGLRDLITSSPSLMDLRRACSKRGMRTLREDGLQKVGAGLTTVDEIVRVTEV